MCNYISLDLRVAPVGVRSSTAAIAAVDLLLETVVALGVGQPAVGAADVLDGEVDLLERAQVLADVQDLADAHVGVVEEGAERHRLGDGVAAVAAPDLAAAEAGPLLDQVGRGAGGGRVGGGGGQGEGGRERGEEEAGEVHVFLGEG